MKIQVSIGGYSGGMATLYAIHDETSDILTIGKVSDFNRARFRDSLVVSNVDVDAWDSRFSDENMYEAVLSWHKRQSTNKIVFGDQAQRANPTSAVQILKIEEGGRKFEISDSVTSAQIATLAACWQADTSLKITESQNFADKIKTLMSGGMISI